MLDQGEKVITNKGKPAAQMLDVSIGNFEVMFRAVRQAKAMLAFKAMRTRAMQRGHLSDEEIKAEIAACRAEKSSDTCFW